VCCINLLLITRFHVVKVPRSRFTKFELWNAAQSTTSAFQLAISVSHICTCMNGSQWNENCSVTTPLANLLSTRLGLLVVWSPGWQVWVPNYLCMPIIPPSCWPQTKPFLRHPPAVYHSTQNKDRCEEKYELLAQAKQKPSRSPFVFLSWLEMHFFNSLDKNMAILAKSQQMGLQDGFNISPQWLFRVFQDDSLTFHTSQSLLQILKRYQSNLSIL